MRRILLVDDDEQFRGMLRKVLARAGYEVEEAENGSVALKKYQARASDVVITDLVMPEREGLETIMELRRLHPDVKLIAISGGGRGDAADYLAVAGTLGATRTLAKPFSHQEILEAVSAVIDRGA